MFHNLLFIYLVRDVMWPHETRSSALFFGVYLGLVLGLSIISYELVEKPFLRLKEKLAIIKSRKA
jgi:peptidoglycan/LPS O-acetylase OafA/YrhL